MTPEQTHAALDRMAEELDARADAAIAASGKPVVHVAPGEPMPDPQTLYVVDIPRQANYTVSLPRPGCRCPDCQP